MRWGKSRGEPRPTGWDWSAKVARGQGGRVGARPDLPGHDQTVTILGSGDYLAAVAPDQCGVMGMALD